MENLWCRVVPGKVKPFATMVISPNFPHPCTLHQHETATQRDITEQSGKSCLWGKLQKRETIRLRKKQQRWKSKTTWQRTWVPAAAMLAIYIMSVPWSIMIYWPLPLNCFEILRLGKLNHDDAKFIPKGVWQHSFSWKGLRNGWISPKEP